MATPNQEAIDTFISITGASDAVAARKLEEHRGNLNIAVNAYFSEGDQNPLCEARVNTSQDDAMDIDDMTPALQRDVRQVPIDLNDSSRLSDRANDAPTTEDVTETDQVHGPAAQGAVTVDEETFDDSPSDATGQSRHAVPAGSTHNNFQDYNGVEEEMIRAAIEASKMETGGSRDHLPEPHQSLIKDDDNVTKAVTMSEREASEVVPIPGQQGTQASNGRFAAPSSPSSDDDSDYTEEQPLVRHRPRRAVSGYQAPPTSDPSPSPEVEPTTAHSPDAGNGFPSEWGGISSEEHDEAVMLEAAMFGGVPESEYNFHYASHQQRAQRPPSPSLTAQRLIREQQDDEYFASLEADREKEMKAIRDAEARRLEEENARVEALEEARRKFEEEQELERQLAAKEASLPREPPAGSDNAVTLLVRMPDGTRRGRGFLKTDKLQSLLDFIDICRIVKPNSYMLVRPYPRHAFSDEESSSTLNEVGLTSKQEALFLELI